MGRWVNIYKGAEDGIVGHLTPRLAPFASWYAGVREPDDPLGEAVEELLHRLVSGKAPPIVSTPREAKIVDRMVADFYGSYCDTVARAEVESIEGPNLYVRRYARLVDWVAEALEAAGSELWEHLLHGRGIWRDGNAVAFDDDGDAYFVGYVTLTECEALAPVMARASPPADGEVEAYAYVARAVRLGASGGHGLILEAG